MSTTSLRNSGELVLQIQDLSKCYRIYDHPRDRLLQSLWNPQRPLYREFWALRKLNFSLGRGQTLGVIGRNGSGKSTLLQLICGTLTPTTGQVKVQGRIGALLELGSGFNPEFSGLENVFLNASLLGLRQSEIEERLDDILAFADIGSFLDQPVKTYSSGMVVRLAFAVQAHIDPDLLVVDEALAVGDELFQKKCYAHLEQLKERGTSILLVTHSCPQIIQHCDEALLLHRGQARLLGHPARVTVQYQRLINASDEEWDRVLPKLDIEQMPTEEEQISSRLSSSSAKAEGSASMVKSSAWLDQDLNPDSTIIYPEHGARIENLEIKTITGESANVLPIGEPFQLIFHYMATQDLVHVACGCHIASVTGQRLCGQRYPEDIAATIATMGSGERWSVCFRFVGGLWPGVYFIGGGIWSEQRSHQAFLHRVVDFRALRVIETKATAVIGSCNLQMEPPVLQQSASST